MEELLKAFEKDHGLGDEAKAMWSKGASAREVADMLAEAGLGFDIDQVEELLAALQASRAEAISDGEKVDRGQLRAVAGGTDCGADYSVNGAPDGAHLGKCSEQYLTTECAATVESGSWCWSNDTCVVLSENYTCVGWWL